MAADVTDPLFWVDRLSQRLMARQNKYQRNYDYAIGAHPLPTADRRYERVLEDLFRKSITNYVGLAIKATTERMRVRGFRFGDPKELDQDAREIWNANNMSLQSVVAIKDAATLADTYILVSPGLEPGGVPIITVEDPRCCIVEPDPSNPLLSLAGLKFYEDSIQGVVVAVLYMKDFIYAYRGPAVTDLTSRDVANEPRLATSGPGGYELISVQVNQLGKVPLIRGPWQPEHGVMGMSECEDGGLDIQDRLNTTVLHRLTISRSQAFRQRWATGLRNPHGVKAKGGPKENMFQPADDMVWAVQNEKARFGDFQQADITQLLEAARDDVGDFAAVTQTPVTYLTNKMVNVSAQAMTAAQSSLMSKVASRQQAMGWFFEEVMKTAFLYLGNAKASEISAETVWEDAEDRSMSEVADMISKLITAGVPVQPTLEYANVFSEEQIQLAVEEVAKAKQQEQQMAEQQLQAKQAQPAQPQRNSSGRER